MKFYSKLLIVLCLAISTKGVMAQGNWRLADTYLFDKNFDGALVELEKLLQSDPENIKYNFNIGVCYLNTHFEKIKAVPYLQKVLFYDEFASNAYYFLGKAYQYNHDFDRAIDNFNLFLKYGESKEIREEVAIREIEYCENAFQLVRRPLKIKYDNIGGEINSPYPDFFPFVPLDESFLVFSTRRDDGSAKERNGQFKSNIYFSRVENGEFTNAVPVEGVNTNAGNETVVGLSGDGHTILVNIEKNGENTLYTGTFKDGLVSDLNIVDEDLSHRTSSIAASISPDGNTIYYSSPGKGGEGGTDLWVTRKLPRGKWSVPQNLGPEINTEFDEEFPNISPDGKTLYYSSKGHVSMGGYDIFKAEFLADSNRFVNPRNMGFPINSVSDDMNYRLSRTGRYGYLTCVRQEGYGELDMYRITIEEVDPDFSVLKGIVKSSDGSPIDFVEITVVDNRTGELVGIYAPNLRSMRYVIIVPPGVFEVSVEADGFQPQEFTVDVLGKGSFQSEIDKDIILSP